MFLTGLALALHLTAAPVQVQAAPHEWASETLLHKEHRAIHREPGDYRVCHGTTPIIGNDGKVTRLPVFDHAVPCPALHGRPAQRYEKPLREPNGRV